MTGSFGGLVRWSPVARPGSIGRFDPAWWTLDFNLPAAASVVTTGPDSLAVHALYRFSDDFVGLIWESEDRWSHPRHRYEARPSYRGLTLRFRWQADAGALPLGPIDPEAVNVPTLTIETAGGATHHLPLWYFRVLPNPNAADDDPHDQVIEIVFDDELYADLDPGPGGSFIEHYRNYEPEVLARHRVPVDEITRLMLSILPAGYGSAQGHQPLDPPVAFTVEIRDIAVAGDGAALARVTAAEPAHTLRLTDGYDNAYHLTPERVVAQAWQLGYRELWVLYLGISHFHNLKWDEASFTWIVDPEAPGLNPPAAAWLADFCARLQAAGYGLWLSLSFEVLASYMPAPWAQRNHADEIATTGWTPPSSLIAPTSAEALAWLAKVAGQALDIATAAGLAPRFQIGEPWWWDGAFSDQAPYIYDFGSLLKYHDETGLFAPEPRLDSVFAEIGPHGPYLEWCRDQLGAATQTLIAAVRDAHPATETALLLFTPQVFRPDSAILELLNFPGQHWAWPAFDVLQIEDYDWIVEGRFDLARRTWAVAYETLGYPPGQVHYFAGFVLWRERAWQWRHIDRAITQAFDRDDAPAEVWVWSREQVLRDGYTVGAPAHWPAHPGPARLTTLAVCWKLSRRDGLVQGFTTHDRDLVIDALAYRPAAAFDPSEIASSASLAPGGLEAYGGFSSEAIGEADLRAGLYDGAEVEIFQVDWADLAQPRLWLARGRLGEVSLGAEGFRAELNGAGRQLGLPAGELYQPHCRADLGDPRCGVDLEAWRVHGTVTALGSGQPFAADGGLAGLGSGTPLPTAGAQIIAVDIDLGAERLYDWGRLRFESGANQGFACEVRVLGEPATGQRLATLEPTPNAVEVGDAVSLTPGCDKLAATCRETFDNLVNFRGEPHVPGRDAVLRSARDLK